MDEKASIESFMQHAGGARVYSSIHQNTENVYHDGPINEKSNLSFLLGWASA